MTDSILHDHGEDGIDRRGFLNCMAWAGTGALWAMQGGVLRSVPLGRGPLDAASLGGDLFFDAILAHPQATSVKNTAKKASSTMTRKIAWTTAIVVLSPTCSESPLTCMPW